MAQQLLVERDCGLDPFDPQFTSPRIMQAMASARVGWWTISLPIIES